MHASIDMQQVLDMAFVGFVVFTCWYSLFSSTSDGKARRWKQELLRLEDMLRDLLSEATAASTNLDRSLQRRKEELQRLLTRMETAKRAVPDSPRRAQVQEDLEQADLPNPSWTRSRTREAAAEQIAARVQEPKKRGTMAQRLEAALAKQVEVVHDDDILSRKGFAGEAGDPVAYKVALRLLRSGQEIHIVSRKLGLPISEVRLIDRLIREEQSVEETIQPAAAHIVRQQRAQETVQQSAANSIRGQRDQQTMQPAAQVIRDQRVPEQYGRGGVILNSQRLEEIERETAVL